MRKTEKLTRRNLLSGIAVSAVASLSGCAESTDTDDSPESGTGLNQVTTEETDLVVDFETEHSIDEISIIQPDGELFAERSVATRVRRETFDLGLDYDPGEYEIIGLTDETEQFSSTIDISPDVQITELLLGRNHPDQMYDGASERTIRTEAIISVENSGNGPDAATQLVFTGDIPRATPVNQDRSGIYDIENRIGGHADKIKLPPNEEVVLYSYSTPFGSATDNVTCSTNTTSGKFSTTLETAVQNKGPTRQYNVSYTGEDLVNCEIEIEERS